MGAPLTHGLTAARFCWDFTYVTESLPLACDSRVVFLVEKPIVAQLVNLLPLMEFESSLLATPGTTTGHCPQPRGFITHTRLLRIACSFFPIFLPKRKRSKGVTLPCFVCVCPSVFHTFRLMNQLSEFYEIWYQPISIKRHSNTIISCYLSFA